MRASGLVPAGPSSVWLSAAVATSSSERWPAASAWLVLIALSASACSWPCSADSPSGRGPSGAGGGPAGLGSAWRIISSMTGVMKGGISSAS